MTDTKKEKDMYPKEVDVIPAFTPVVVTLAMKVGAVRSFLFESFFTSV
eukprot:CAMPEP_0114116576 /NCGR_PEP_ID=MMETSP0043_2-20121206/4570_1 /TAXON_ID=464988 /ORGANISM="Hemiselmis andersenii, Strain CCMP644" /LENGTH=47 /DNA_ID= /DNA_START= /DNA_END= /DNA_ORIENTATION=